MKTMWRNSEQRTGT